MFSYETEIAAIKAQMEKNRLEHPGRVADLARALDGEVTERRLQAILNPSNRAKASSSELSAMREAVGLSVDPDDRLVAAIAAAPNLRALCDVLNQAAEGGVELRDYTDLPTFGGDEPEAIAGVFSWDEESYLVYEGGSPAWEVISREEWHDIHG